MLLALAACTSNPGALRWAPGDGRVTGPGGGDPPAATSDPADPSDPGSDPSTPGVGTPPSTTPPGTTPGPCPPGLICVDSFPYVDDNSTTGAPSQVDAYGCAPDTDEGGPELVYQVTLAEEGVLVGGLSDLPAGVDVDVHILDALDPDACVDRGHWDAAALLPAGVYYVVVDSWVDASGAALDGDYTLTLGLNTAGDHASVGLDSDPWSAALYAFDQAWKAGETDRLELGAIDFSLPSTEHRMFWVDLHTGDLLFDLLTSHGIGSQDPSDLTLADTFSNISGSNMSSLGLYRTAETYDGSHGYSLRLDGLEAANDNVRDRAIVIHSADYATQDFVDTYGYLGRSEGCPAVDPAYSDDLIDTVSDGALFLAWYPDQDWIDDSPWLDGY